jgi:hypothetical protein
MTKYLALKEKKDYLKTRKWTVRRLVREGEGWIFLDWKEPVDNGAVAT